MRLLPPFLFLLLLFPAFGQQIYPPKIKIEVDSTLAGHRDFPVNFMDGKFIVNGVEEVNTFEKKKKVEFLLHQHTYADTLYLLGLAGLFSGTGFYLDLYADSARITLYTLTDGPEVFRLNQTDSLYNSKLSVPCSKMRLIMTKLPTYAPDEPMEGWVELESHPFYTRKNDPEQPDDEIKITLHAHFKK